MTKKNHQQEAEALVQALQAAHFTALFAGGWVRDFLLGKQCQDIDIATNAHPEDVMHLFPRSVAVGAQFGVVRVLSHGHEFEVATFRSESQYVDGRRPNKVDLHSSPQEDAQRRDFTINGMFYDPISQTIFDYVGGKEDLAKKVIRTIGSPHDRFKEDRLRMIRAIRLKNTLEFSIDPATWKAICQESTHVAAAVSPERVWQELQKMVSKGILGACLADMEACHLLPSLFPTLTSTSKHVLEERINIIKNYDGTSTIAALCLLFQGEEAAYLAHIADDYHLSRKEKKTVDLFVQYNGLHAHLSDLEWVKLYAHPESTDYLSAVAAMRDDQPGFLHRHQLKQEELQFWINQVKTKKFLVTGEDIQAKGIQPGRAMGQLLSQAFELSVSHRLKEKEAILKQLKL